ncbi:MAG TPA: G1 family glutamic endopeptidase [Chloroflexota bacterium]|nr:G1 family glutamic endopeptidase [Chloroflexota bacterium]
MAAIVIVFALFGALIGFAADHWAMSNGVATPTPVASGPRTGPLAAPDGPATAVADPTQQAIKQVIQRGDDEQAQAFAASDPSVMADTATPDFYQQQVQIDHDLRTNGVSDIKLVTIEWGPITVTGTSATATAYETWSTTYSDGSTEQTRDRNEYTLVQTNGTWLVSADDHPDDNVGVGTGGAPGASSPGASTPGGQGGNPGRARPTAIPGGQPQPSQPRVPRGQDTSQNWSGYSISGGTFTSVTGTWTVPEFTPDSPTGADATWVGIGGVDSRDLIQAGTQQTVSRTGATQYEAWVETLPQTSHPVPLAVNPGDSVTISVTLQPQTQDQWQVSFKNETTGKTYAVTERYTSSMSSAEWIEEAPSAGRGRQIPLDNFGTVTFANAAATKDGQTVTPGQAGAQAITMVARGGQTLAKPSPLGADGASFSVTRS